VKTNLVYLRPVRVLALRVTGRYSTSAADAWDQMARWLRSRGANSQMTPRYGLLLDDPRTTAPDKCRYEACIPQQPELFGHCLRDVYLRQIPSGAYARALHVGGNVGIARTITKIRTEWASKNGLLTDPSRPLIEIYLDTPSKLPIEQQRIDVCVPVMFAHDQSPSAA
jgi:AraC family transcriptional regulator